MRKMMMVAAGMMLLASTAMADDKKMETKKAAPAVSDEQIIKTASAAAPPEITKGATFVAVDDKMASRVVKAGTNGWTCMAIMVGQSPEAMCLDKQWAAWGGAYMTQKDPPPVTGVAVAYMLAGDHGVSNTDPYAKGPTADNHWTVTGAHTMMLLPDAKMLDAYPSDPSAGGPWVMWKGTKYAHVMVPVAEMPKQPAPAHK
jgi:hypothetical protein